MIRLPPTSTLFPYTTLFRSVGLPYATFPTPRRAAGIRRWALPCSLAVTEGILVSFFRSEENTSELQSLTNLVCRLLLEKKNYQKRDCGVRDTCLAAELRRGS